MVHTALAVHAVAKGVGSIIPVRRALIVATARYVEWTDYVGHVVRLGLWIAVGVSIHGGR